MADKRISQLVERVDIANNDVLPIVASGATTTNKVTISSIQTFMQGNLDLGVTSVGITLGTTGTDVNVSGSPITSSGNITINFPTASASNRGLLSSADWITFNSKQPAGNYVTLDTTQTITAQKTFTTSGSSDTMIISHGSGSGFALDVIKAGSGEAIRVNKTSGSGNAMTVIGGNFEAPTIVKTGGTSTQYLMADGSTSTLTNPVTGTGASGQVAFWNGTSSQTGDTKLTFNSSTGLLTLDGDLTLTGAQTIQTSTGNLTLATAAGNGNINLVPNGLGVVDIRNSNDTTNSQVPTLRFTDLDTSSGTGQKTGRIEFSTSDTSPGPSGVTSFIESITEGTSGLGSLIFGTGQSGSATEDARFTSNGNFLLNTTTDAGFRLDVNGTARVQGATTITGVTRIGNSSYNDVTLSGLVVGINGASASRVTIANNGNYQDVQFIATAISSGNINTWSFGQRRDTFFGNTIGSFQIVGSYTDNAGAGAPVGGGYRVPLICNPNGDVIIAGASANAINGNVGIGIISPTFKLDVNGTTRFNGLSTIQGTTASDSGQLGAELLTTGTGDASWTGTSFATGYTHVAGSTTTLTSTLAGVVNTFYQITYTVTGRTAGSFTIGFGGFISGNLTATGAVGPRATTTGTLVITPTSDFNGTIVLSIRIISISSASVTFNNSAGNLSNQLRISSLDSNSFFGLNSGRTNTTGTNNSFYGRDAGINNTTASNNSFFGSAAGQSNTTGSDNTAIGSIAGGANTTGTLNTFVGRIAGQFNTTGSDNTFIGAVSGRNNTVGANNVCVGSNAGNANTTGSSNNFVGFASGFSNTTGVGNSSFGSSSGSANTTGSSNSFFGNNSGRLLADGITALTISNNSVFIGADTRANANNQTNQIVIGTSAIGLGSNTTVLGNASTTHGRWFGNLLVGTSTNNGTNLRVVGTTQSDIITQNLASHGKKVLQYTSVSSTTINLPTEFPLMTGLVVANAYAVFGKFLGKYLSYGQAIEFYIAKNPNGTWNTVAYSDSSQFIASLVSVTGSGNDLTITTQTDTSFILELTVMTQS
jgi:hypothetical protein